MRSLPEIVTANDNAVRDYELWRAQRLREVFPLRPGEKASDLTDLAALYAAVLAWRVPGDRVEQRRRLLEVLLHAIMDGPLLCEHAQKRPAREVYPPMFR